MATCDNKSQTIFPFQLGDKFDTQKFGQHVAGNLYDARRRFIIHTHEFESVECRCRKRFA